MLKCPLYHIQVATADALYVQHGGMSLAAAAAAQV